MGTRKPAVRTAASRKARTGAPKAGPTKAAGFFRSPVVFTSTHQVQRVVKSVALAVDNLGSAAANLGLPVSSGYLPRPAGWPSQVPWRPIRYFGPFVLPEFREITITLKAQTPSAWSFNKFFVNHPDADRFKPFFPGNTLPSTSTPVQDDPPGQVPPANGTGTSTMRLDRMAYSSRFGGSVVLTFVSFTHGGYDLRKDSLVWDLDGLELRLYVNPTTLGLSQAINASTSGIVNCELSAGAAIAYQLTMQGNAVKSIAALDDLHDAELQAALLAIAQAVPGVVSQSALRFVYGFLWSQFPELTGPGRVADSLYLADNWIDLVTHQGIPMVAVRFRAGGIWGVQVGSLADPWGHAEHSVTLGSTHRYSDQKVVGPSRTWYVEPYGSTEWLYVGAWTLDQTPSVKAIEMSISGVEVDAIGADDPFDTVFLEVTLDVAKLQAAHAAKQYGIVEQIRFMPTSDYQDGSGGPFFDVSVEVLLNVK